jgi:hypothetical protein
MMNMAVVSKIECVSVWRFFMLSVPRLAVISPWAYVFVVMNFILMDLTMRT